MPFSPDGLVLNRNGFYQPNVMSYYYTNDSIEEVKKPGYFPPFLGGDSNQLIVNDTITVTSTSDNDIDVFLFTSPELSLLSNPLFNAKKTYFQAFISGAFNGTLDFYVYKDFANSCMLLCKGPYSFTAIEDGGIQIKCVIPIEFRPSAGFAYNTLLQCTINEVSQYLNISIDVKDPFITCSNLFKVGDVVNIEKTVSLYS